MSLTNGNALANSSDSSSGNAPRATRQNASGLAILTAAPIEIVIGRESLRATPLTLADYGELDEALLAARPDPMERALMLCESLQRALLSTAFDELCHGWPVTAHEMSLWMSSRAGLAHVLWLAVRTHQPHLTLQDCRELLLGEPQWRQALRALDKINGLPQDKPLGKPSGRARRPKTAAATRAASRGAKCFAG
jgi:hypothetical protein